MSNYTIIDVAEIELLYKEYCKENKTKFSKRYFVEFVKFLEIDLYDWVKENLRSFLRYKN